MIAIEQTTNHKIIGLGAALKFIGESVNFWNPKVLPVFDMLKTKKPDILILENATKDVIDATSKYCTKMIVFGLYQNDNVILNCIDNIHPTILKNLNEPYYNIKVAADYVRYFNKNKFDKNGVVIRYKDSPVTTSDFNLIINICDKLAEKNSAVPLKILSAVPLPSPYYGGITTEKENKELISKAAILVDFNDQYYDGIINGTFSLSTTNDMYCESKNITNNIEIFLEQPLLLKSRLKRAIKDTKQNQTYFNRLKDIAQILNKSQWEEKCQKAIEDILKAAS
jgi:hypothetical protein